MKTINFGSDRVNKYVPEPWLVQLPSHLPSAAPVVCQQLHSLAVVQPDDLQDSLFVIHYKVYHTENMIVVSDYF